MSIDPTYVEIEYRGDPSVGIWGGALNLKGLPPIDAGEEREGARKLLAESFEAILGEPASVSWGDEILEALEADRPTNEVSP